ncbi:GPHN [Mytilus edulis]|uniref:molybdopterin molybdotransferase n=1 Tax=Mytilus edulis TaxID=6550 RepID=A0A8S3U318_MYTED|nr:GPHN [Mytilus edulis]
MIIKLHSYHILVSDSCSENRAEDRSGTNLCRLIREENLINGSVAVREIVSDDADKIKNKLMDWSDVKKLNLILTTGGTGFSQRDVTPEATKAILEKEAIGITIAMITQSLQVTKLAMLSRLVCGSRGQSLIINLPGSVKGSEDKLGEDVETDPLQNVHVTIQQTTPTETGSHTTDSINRSGRLNVIETTQHITPTGDGTADAGAATDCVGLQFDGTTWQWTDQTCNTARRYICEYPRVSIIIQLPVVWK